MRRSPENKTVHLAGFESQMPGIADSHLSWLFPVDVMSLTQRSADGRSHRLKHQLMICLFGLIYSYSRNFEAINRQNLSQLRRQDEGAGEKWGLVLGWASLFAIGF